MLTMPNLSIRLIGLLLGFSAALLLAGSPARAEVQSDLSAIGIEAAQAKVPVMLVFWADYCTYCELLEEEVLIPLKASSTYPQRLRLVRVEFGAQLYTDFSGQKISGSELASRYDVDITPTVLMVAPDGRLLADPLIGLASVDFYWAYLDNALEEAEARLLDGN